MEGKIYDDAERLENLKYMTNKEALNVYSRYSPVEREAFHLRRFLPPPGYLSPNVVEMLFSAHLQMALISEADGTMQSLMQGSTANVFCMAVWQAMHGWPMYAVTEDLLEAMLLTDPPSEMTWGELEWPLEAITFLLPDSSRLREYLHCPESAVSISMGRVLKPPVGKVTTLGEMLSRIRMPDGHYRRDMGVLVYFDPKIGAPMFHDVTAKPEWTLGETLFNHGSRAAGPNDADLEDVDYIRMERITKIGINLLGFMTSTCEPDIVGPMTKHRPGKEKKGRVIDALYGVRWLGQGFRLKRPPAPGEGHHKSPRWHWRRGYFRNQPFGPGRKQRKVLWLQPTIVNAEGKEVGV